MFYFLQVKFLWLKGERRVRKEKGRERLFRKTVSAQASVVLGETAPNQVFAGTHYRVNPDNPVGTQLVASVITVKSASKACSHPPILRDESPLNAYLK